MIWAWEVPVLIWSLIRTKVNRCRCFHLCHYTWAQTLRIRWFTELSIRLCRIVYGESWDDICDSCHSGTPGLALCQYRRVSWHWFQGLRHDSYLDINFFIITFDECQEILKWWYLGNYLGWDLETSVSLRADIDIMPNPGLSNDMKGKYHLTFHHIRSAQSNRQLSKSPYSQCLSPGVME